MSRLPMLLRYDWPLHFVLFLTNWLPDNVFFLRLRGFLSKPFLARCGDDLRLGRNVSFYNPSNIHIGSHVYLAFGCVLLAGTQPISLSDEVIMGPYCVLASNNHTLHEGSYRYGNPESAAIAVGRGVWLGAHVVITSGSIINEGTLIAAGAVVTGNIPENVIAGGVPARVIRTSVQ